MQSHLVKKQDTAILPEQTFEAMLAQAATLIKSGFLPKAIKTPEQALVVMQTGRELGLAMMQSFRAIFVIHGTPSLYPQAMRALVENSGKCEKFEVLEATGKQCRINVQRKGRAAREVIFTFEMASKMSTAEYDGDNKKMIPLTNTARYQKMPEVMLEWRCTSKACRTEFPEIVLGLYTPEELGAQVRIRESDDDGTEIIEVTEPVKPVKQDVDTTSEISDDKLGEFVMPEGNQFAGLRLTQIMAQETGTGRAKGMEFLEGLQETHPDPRLRDIVRRFLNIMLKD